jgi:hypothetical protein
VFLSPTPFRPWDDPEGVDEHRLFQELHRKYNWAAGRGYQALMAEWNKRCQVEAYKNMA